MQMFNDPLYRLNHKSSYNNEKISLQMNEINVISGILLIITSQYDRITEVYNNRDIQYVDFTNLEKQSDELPSQISKIYDSLQRIQNISHKVEERIQQTNVTYKGINRIISSLERFEKEIKNKIGELNGLKEIFEQHRASASILFEELSSLATWYELFYNSYGELIFEISRRHKEHRRQQEIVEIYQKELNLMHQMESQKREQFQDFYGKYLPPSLCPSISEPSTHYQIYPEKFSTNLPNIGEVERDSKKQIGFALSQIKLE